MPTSISIHFDHIDAKLRLFGWGATVCLEMTDRKGSDTTIDLFFKDHALATRIAQAINSACAEDPAEGSSAVREDAHYEIDAPSRTANDEEVNLETVS